MLKKWEEKEIERLLRASDGEFVPPLSSGKSTTYSVLRSVLRNRKKTSTNDNLASILRQKNIYAIQDDKMIGFLSYYKRDTDVYVSTIIVDKEFRGMGVGEALWRSFLRKHPTVTTRTWSTNETHIRLLKRVGFYETKRLRNDRGRGIDTVYYEYRGRDSFITIAYQGDIESNSDYAARHLISDYYKDLEDLNDSKNLDLDHIPPKDCTVPLITSDKVVGALLNNEIDYGLVAYSNSIGGLVEETQRALKGEIYIVVDTLEMPVHHCLFAHHKNFKYIASHPQALKQTEKTRKEKWPVGTITVSDQALAAKIIKKYHTDDVAVICRKEAGEGLQLIAENIEDDTNNTILFLLIEMVDKYRRWWY